ncbi:sugar ABC transporter substrate-binding protein [Mesorhizobium sp. M4B.F.Ca.ET.215.01.1.1]|uniref:ABC transporter substrate-binding protein n=1 Tax=unclassified Mesorhizobium TaxID=325217 RepID=UPI000FCC3DB5|nr:MULTISPECIES: sugar ABC transporter substrate-binding protein [unclassified Mesorhizobium]RUW27204.1 sugar ABC transporter substrate-binding protein [Mesorhizobium sp. M4B.F.Ca.ET.013.02.1.1]RVD41222.1 sugar ABC transporter substrate-binding protein [Mesorhizobium sp. M4B.F.Ca.ET.019.03.1.1]RWF61749.1 MAG: sugar ABC transporter substrate-binding protein [Mesorhizobium sp.]TGQ10615.1 sugar ABC transporter substrate-binding protein [Mesorhizobium sp. M4B.F.Ca.ET.215.01.1.1]TGQ38119.1 sugar AB
MSLAKWTVGLMAGMSMLAFAAPADAGEVRVTVAEYSAKTGPYFQDVKKEFEAANPGITVKFEVVPWEVLLQKLTTDITAGTNADLSIIGTRWLIDFVQQDVAEPLDGYITPDFKDRFIDTFLSPSIMEGKTYGLPIAASARAMYYNKELFEKAGIAKPPATWTELQEDARKIKALGSGTFGFGLQGKEIETDVYYYYAMWSQGTEILNKDGTSGLGTQGALDAAKLYKSMIDEGLTEPGVTSNNREDVQNLFKQGKVGMMITAPFLSNQIKEEAPNLKYGVAAIPAGPTGARGTYGVTDSIIMFKNSKNKDEAWKLLDFLFTKEQRAKFTQGEGFLPVNKEEAKMDYYVNNADLAAFTALLPDARFAPVIPGWEEIAQITSDAMQKIYLGSAEPEAALKEAAEKANGVLKK